ncbi:ABC transporter permease [Thermocrispum agreste]|uniref:Transport permease protein n=1 Tax=Thermocrispum agreste TaxID=37925 RepID=A0A2W4JAM7_9PSEU|nr:ABC transporter permease [Thermocrispum agreste]PZM90627.1 MAG: ABC transporter permease [Thermocrispum agreste]
MNASGVAIRAGIRRGLAEIRQMLTSGPDLLSVLFFPTITLIVMYFLRDSTLPGTDISVGSAAMPGVLGMQVAFAGLVGVSASLMVEREDGTLLRAKAVPNGMFGYLVGKIIVGAFDGALAMLIVLIPGLFLLDGFRIESLNAWLTLAWVLALGLIATMPIGAMIGSLSDNPRNMGLVMLPLLGLVAISGVFYPITALPGWVQFIAQLFPIYWLGLGMRSALLPDAAAAVEIGGSWRYAEMIGVLGVWIVVGLIFAPILLRRMARRESGSTVAARRDRALQRVQ